MMRAAAGSRGGVETMRLAVFSDIHGNLEALRAFVRASADLNLDRYICLGDIVGYGARPNECIELVRSLPRVNFILGNHDAAAIWDFSPYAMSGPAKEAILWTMDQLTPASIGFLKRLTPVISMGGYNFSHANPYNPRAWRYVNNRKYAARTFSGCKAKTIFVAHTHRRRVITRRNPFQIRFSRPGGADVMGLDARRRQIFNCGSIGQSRDGRPEAVWLVLDTRAGVVEYHAADYDPARPGNEIRAAGLPVFLADRLTRGC